MTSPALDLDLRPAAAEDPRSRELLTPAALDFLGRLHRAFATRRDEELDRRAARSAALAAGERLDFLEDTRAIREDPGWRVAAPAPGLEDRRVEISGPPDPKLAVRALSSGAHVWIADLEDATSPTWQNIVEGHLAIRDAAAGTLDHTSEDGRRHVVAERAATIMMRPRGWHLCEAHLSFCGRSASASLVDAGLYLFHCARPQIERGAGPYLYLPKLESHHEARLWNDVFCFAQDALDIPRGTIRATVLIETLPAAFEMEEILFELREHSAGLNAGRWAYLFSVIKNLGRDPEAVLPDRAAVDMTVPFLRAYTDLLVKTCHKRGAHAIGGMAAFIPSGDEAADALALAEVREDKRREAADGFDGSSVAHPDLVATCRGAFDTVLGSRPDQLARLRDDVCVTARNLLAVEGTPGTVTAAGLRGNVAVTLRYIESWLRGTGAVAIAGLMEDAATAEIARGQLWQWIHHATPLPDGTVITRDLVLRLLDEEHAALVDEELPRVADARQLLEDLTLGERLCGFFTPHAYRRHLTTPAASPGHRNGTALAAAPRSTVHA